ncbi:hypothetical protein AGMMS49941_00500 [Deferribacterales bacterium]|nr:hypothetical protein AGMMS49941_00500 [Deferribacterales bacterium]
MNISSGSLINATLPVGGGGDFPQYLSIVTTVRNEIPYMAEWIEYHLLVGVEKFYIYGEDDDIELREFMKPYIEDGVVEYLNFGESTDTVKEAFDFTNVVASKQRRICGDAVKRFKYNTFWLAFVDVDEFLVPISTNNIPDFLRDFEDEVGVEVNWLIYGDGGHKTKTNELVMERFRDHSERDTPYNYTVKTIFNPRYVFKAGVHAFEYWHKKRNVAVDTHKQPKRIKSTSITSEFVYHDKLRINHYIVRTIEEYMSRRLNIENSLYNDRAALLEKFAELNHNEIKNDNIMDRYVPLVKERIAKRFATR